MKKTFILPALILLMCFAFKAKAQHQLSSYISDSLHRSQNVFIEIGGPGLVVSANYDCRFSNSREGWGATAGVGYLPNKTSSLLTIPVQINYLMGSFQHYLELGAGGTYLKYKSGTVGEFIPFHNEANKQFVGTATIGYRYQPIDRGYNFRASFNPVFDQHSVYAYAGVGFGYTF